MDIIDLKKSYQNAKEGQNLSDGERVSRNLGFIKMLLSDNSEDIIDYHYNLMKKREYKDLYYHVRAAMKRRPNIEKFLVDKIATETDPITSGDILHLLGGLRSPHAAVFARQFVKHNDEYQREVALYVLGWVGDEADILILNDHLLNEKQERLRITAASAHRQIHFRLSDLKNKLLLSLKKGFEAEENDEVIAWIIVMIESIAVKRLGLREDKEDPYIIHGDVQKAKVKTAKFLAEFGE